MRIKAKRSDAPGPEYRTFASASRTEKEWVPGARAVPRRRVVAIILDFRFAIAMGFAEIVSTGGLHEPDQRSCHSSLHGSFRSSPPGAPRCHSPRPALGGQVDRRSRREPG